MFLTADVYTINPEKAPLSIIVIFLSFSQSLYGKRQLFSCAFYLTLCSAVRVISINSKTLLWNTEWTLPTRDQQTEVQRGWVNSPRSQSYYMDVQVLSFKPRFVRFQACVLSLPANVIVKLLQGGAVATGDRD